MSERDKLEPFWARPSRTRRGGPPPLVVPGRDTGEPPAPAAPPPEDLREPSFTISHAARRAAIAEVMASAAAREVAPAPAAAPSAGEPDVRQAPSLGAAPPEEIAAPDAHGWISLSRAQAARHPLYGVDGWLVALAAFLALGLAMGLVELFDFWATTDHGGLSAWIMAGLRSVMALWATVIFVLLVARSRAFPTAFVAYTLFYIIYLGLFGLAFAHVTNGAVFTGVAAAVPLHLIAIAYVLRSRRVNVTFRRRVRAKKRAEAQPAGAEPSPA